MDVDGLIAFTEAVGMNETDNALVRVLLRRSLGNINLLVLNRQRARLRPQQSL